MNAGILNFRRSGKGFVANVPQLCLVAKYEATNFQYIINPKIRKMKDFEKLTSYNEEETVASDHTELIDNPQPESPDQEVKELINHIKGVQYAEGVKRAPEGMKFLPVRGWVLDQHPADLLLWFTQIQDKKCDLSRTKRDAVNWLVFKALDRLMNATKVNEKKEDKP